MGLKLLKNSLNLLAPNFVSQEFDCHCEECTETLIEQELVLGLQRIRDALKKPLKILSGYRCATHQKKLESEGYETAKNSTHLCGAAADFTSEKQTGDQLEAVARGCGFKAVGVAASWVHVDLRSDRDRRWTYKTR